MTTTPTPEPNPSQEAVAAAMRYATMDHRRDAPTMDDLILIGKHVPELLWGSGAAHPIGVALILAAEVARLRGLPRISPKWVVICPNCAGVSSPFKNSHDPKSVVVMQDEAKIVCNEARKEVLP